MAKEFFQALVNLRNSLSKVIKTDFPEIDIPSLGLEVCITKEMSQGDFSTNAVFKIAKILNRDPLEIGRVVFNTLGPVINDDLSLKNIIQKCELKPPGFINFFVAEHYLHGAIVRIILEKDNYGRPTLGEGENVQVEFVSANPTGPLSIAHGRQAAIGDALAKILTFIGYSVTKEYYINDEGLQIDNLGKSIWVRYRQQFGENLELPEDGYKGDYISELAQKVPANLKGKYSAWNIETKEFFTTFGCREILSIIKDDLNKFGVQFDSWVKQSDLIKSGRVSEAISFLRKKGFIYDKDGALWLKSTLFGDDKDRVVVKSDGSFTYIASDIAYHKAKFERGFKEMINLWGPDHHGYIPRLLAAVQALGYNPQQLKILIVQLATLYRNGQFVPMSTRAGSFVTLKEVIDEVGKDVARFFFLKRRLDSHLEFDLTAAKEESLENPVYYIQYANARIASLGDYARKNGIDLEVTAENRDSLISVLNNLTGDELILARILQQFPYVLLAVHEHLEPNLLISYLETLAKTFHQYYARYRIVGSDSNITQARILMASAIAVVIKNGLGLLGVSFPDKM